MPNCGIENVPRWASCLAFPRTAGSFYESGPESLDQYVLKGSFGVSWHVLAWSQSCCRLTWWSCDSVMWETRELRENLGFLFAALPLWLPGLAETGIKQRALKSSLERIPCFPSSSSSLPSLKRRTLFTYLLIYLCLFILISWKHSFGTQRNNMFWGKSYLVSHDAFKTVKQAKIFFLVSWTWSLEK